MALEDQISELQDEVNSLTKLVGFLLSARLVGKRVAVYGRTRVRTGEVVKVRGDRAVVRLDPFDPPPLTDFPDWNQQQYRDYWSREVELTEKEVSAVEAVEGLVE